MNKIVIMDLALGLEEESNLLIIRSNGINWLWKQYDSMTSLRQSRIMWLLNAYATRVRKASEV